MKRVYGLTPSCLAYRSHFTWPGCISYCCVTAADTDVLSFGVITTNTTSSSSVTGMAAIVSILADAVTVSLSSSLSSLLYWNLVFFMVLYRSPSLYNSLRFNVALAKILVEVYFVVWCCTWCWPYSVSCCSHCHCCQMTLCAGWQLLHPSPAFSFSAHWLHSENLHLAHGYYNPAYCHRCLKNLAIKLARNLSNL